MSAYPALVQLQTPSRPYLRDTLALALVLCALFAGCTVQFVSSYDEFTDSAVHALHIRTNQFVARASATRAGYGESTAFYAEAKATVQAIRTRSEMLGKNEEEVRQLRALEDQYDRLAAKHRLGPITPNLAGSLEFGFRKLIRIQLAKKRGLKLNAAPTGDAVSAAPE